MTIYQNVKYQLNMLLEEDNPNKEFYYKFTSHHNGDSGIDLFNETIEVEPFKVGTINHKMKCEMIDLSNNTFCSYYLVPRSSISKTNFQLANSIGIIDAGYRGNIMSKIRNINMENSTLQSGSYFQIVAPDLSPIKLNIVDSLSETTRNDGFGSTNNYELYFDGSCKLNNNNGGCSFVLYLNGNEIKSFSKKLENITNNITNNISEYSGLLEGLKYCKENNIRKLKVFGDSLLVINQCKGLYKVKSPNLINMYNDIELLMKSFDSIEFNHVCREYNTRADQLSKQ